MSYPKNAENFILKTSYQRIRIIDQKTLNRNGWYDMDTPGVRYTLQRPTTQTRKI